MKTIINLLLNSLAVFVSGYILPGVQIEGFGTAVVVAVALGIVNVLIKPLFILLTLPVTILTLGIFALFINAFMILIVSSFVSGFKVDGILWAFIFGLVLSLVSSFLRTFI
jgi:putative membrane protein